MPRPICEMTEVQIIEKFKHDTWLESVIIPTEEYMRLELAHMCGIDQMVGLPDGKGGWYPPKWLAPLCKEGAYGMLMLHGLREARSDIQEVAQKLMLERCIHEHRLSDDVLILAIS